MASIVSFLNNEQEERLQKFFSTPVRFHLLYKSSHHGAGVSKLLSSFDNSGKFLLAVFLQSGTVCGAFTSKSLKCGTEFSDKEAFVFEMKAHDAKQFPVINTAKAITVNTQHSSPQPFLFGSSMTNVTQNKDYIAFGSCLNVTLENDKLYVSFRNEGEYGATWSLENNVCCADVELHRVQDLVGLLPSPWREVSWTDATRESLRKEFVSYKLPTNYPVSQVKALLLGPEGSGKSCFINSVRSTMYKRIVRLPNVGTAVKGFFTKKLTVYDIRGGKGSSPTILRFIDVLAIEDDDSIGIPQLILLSHVDQVCPAVQKDLMYVYLSRDVQEKMEKAAELVGLPVSYVLPVKNYVSQLTVDCNTDILLLSAVMNILQAVDDTMEDQYPSVIPCIPMM